MSGGYGQGGHPGQGYETPDDDPDRTRPRRQVRGRPQPSGSVWENDQGYPGHDAPPGYNGQDYPGQGYGIPAPAPGPAQPDGGIPPLRSGGRPRGGQYRPQPGPPQGAPGQYGGDQPGGPPPRYEPPTQYDMPRQHDQDSGYRPPPGPPPGGQYGAGAQPARGTGGMPRQHEQHDQRGTGPRRPADGYDQRGTQPPAGPASHDQGRYDQGGHDQGGYDDWEQDRRDNSFLPGFDRREEFDDGRVGSFAAEPDGRYSDYPDYDNEDDERLPPRDGIPDDYDDDAPGDRAGHGRDDRERGPRKKATRWFPRILILSIVAVLVIGGLTGGLYVYHQYESRYHPADYAGAGTGEVTVQVMSGDTAFSLAPRLLQLGVIASTRAFTNAAEAAASSAGLEAGYYQLHEHMRASLAYTDVTNPANRLQTTVTIPEGKRAVDVIAILAAKTKIPLTDFQQVIAHPAQLGLPSYANGKAEGFLFPATYAIVPHETALQILQAMVQRFNAEAQQDNLVSAAQSAGLTPAQLITEASLAQAEGGSVSDYPKIAEVIHNRLATGMHLQFDSTVLYGLGKYAVSATFKQINTPGPYNTYLNAGLPPGPISNPGDAAIQGVLHPDHGNWLYFLTVPDGKSQFSATPLKGQ